MSADRRCSECGATLAGEALSERAATKPHHTNIVPVDAIGHEGGSYFSAIGLVEGQALSPVLDDLTIERRSRSRRVGWGSTIGRMCTRLAQCSTRC